MKRGIALLAGFYCTTASAQTALGGREWALYGGIAIAGVGLALLLALYIWAWRVRRSQQRAGGARSNDDPSQLADISPADLRIFERGRYDARCLAVDLVDMAVRGYLWIGREKRVIGFRWRLLRQTAVGEEVLAPTQLALVTRLFARAETVELIEANVRRIANSAEVHEEALLERRPRAQAGSNRPVLVAGILFSLVYSVAALLLARIEGALVIAGLALPALLAHALVAWRMPKPFDAAAAMRTRIERLRALLSSESGAGFAGQDLAERSKRYQALLPYAMALDLQTVWADGFRREVGTEAAAGMASRLGWYHGSGSEVLNDLHELNRALAEGLTEQVEICTKPAQGR